MNRKTLFDMTPVDDLRSTARRYAAADARDAALQVCAERNGDFMHDGLESIRTLPSDEYTGEQIRILLTAQGIEPKHHNGWGSLVMSAVKAKYLKPTGRYVAMQTDRSHARKTQIYQR